MRTHSSMAHLLRIEWWVAIFPERRWHLLVVKKSTMTILCLLVVRQYHFQVSYIVHITSGHVHLYTLLCLWLAAVLPKYNSNILNRWIEVDWFFKGINCVVYIQGQHTCRSGKWTGRKQILQGWGFHLESGKTDILKKSQRKLKWFSMADLIQLFKAGRNVWGHHDLNDIFS